MTTISYHHGDGEVAIDSRVTSGGIINSDNYDKTIKNKAGLWFFSGSGDDFKSLSLLSHRDKSIDLDCYALLIYDGSVFGVSVGDGICTHTKYRYNNAFGSGGEFALAAMDHGKSAKEAVKYAMTRDVYTGGRVRVFKVRS